MHLNFRYIIYVLRNSAGGKKERLRFSFTWVYQKIKSKTEDINTEKNCSGVSPLQHSYCQSHDSSYLMVLKIFPAPQTHNPHAKPGVEQP